MFRSIAFLQSGQPPCGETPQVPASWWVPPQAAPTPTLEAARTRWSGLSQKGRCFLQSVCGLTLRPRREWSGKAKIPWWRRGSLAQVTAPASHPSHSPSRGEPHPFLWRFTVNSFHRPHYPTLPYQGFPANPTSQAKLTMKLNPGEAQSWHWGWTSGSRVPSPSPPQLEDAWKSSIRPASLPLRETASHGVTVAQLFTSPGSPQSPAIQGGSLVASGRGRPSTHGGLL